MKNERTVSNLRNSIEGRLYVFLRTEEICRVFYKNAESEGFMFGEDIRPTKSPYNDVISLEKNCLYHTGFAGHLGFHNPQAVADGVTRVDYEKYIRGDEDYFYVKSQQTSERTEE